MADESEDAEIEAVLAALRVHMAASGFAELDASLVDHHDGEGGDEKHEDDALGRLSRYVAEARAFLSALNAASAHDHLQRLNSVLAEGIHGVHVVDELGRAHNLLSHDTYLSVRLLLDSLDGVSVALTPIPPSSTRDFGPR